MISFRPGFTRKRIAAQLIWPSMWLGVTGAGAWLSPSLSGHGTHMQLGLPPCPSVLLWDKPCPGCGLTTSISALLHGEFSLAWSSHPFGVLLYALLTVAAALCAYAWFKTKRVDCSSKTFRTMTGLLVVAYVCFGAVRFAVSPSFHDPYSVGYRLQSSRK
jgi:hypothetical protein